MKLRKCKGCGAEIAFVRASPRGGWMPINAEPHPDGNVVVVADWGTVLSPRGAAEARDRGRPTYLSHFATCEQAGAFRGRRRGG